MTNTEKWLMEMFKTLLKSFGPQHWWPGETDLEIMVGAILTQNTNWNNVEKAIDNLKTRDRLSLPALKKVGIHELAQDIMPAGYYNIKAKRLKNLIEYINSCYGLDMARISREETSRLREALLSVNGIGPETADSILLYAFDRPVFVIDAYTFRILNRHGMADEQESYYDLQSVFMDNLPEDSKLYNEFHALIVRTGKEFCKKKPLCKKCPLKQWGPIIPDFKV